MVVHRDGIEYDGADTDSYVEAPKPVEYDTSKIDPLDIDAWRRLVEGEVEKVDYALHGGKYVSIFKYDCCLHQLAIRLIPPDLFKDYRDRSEGSVCIYYAVEW